MLSHEYCEQLTVAARSLELLQCWARKVGISHVMEPFIMGTVFRSPPRGQERDSLRFNNVYDLDNWNGMSRGKKYPPIVTWEDFLEHAPRNLIVVDVAYNSLCMLAEKERTEIKGCSVPTSLNDLVSKLEENKFKVVREVCLDFSAHRRMITMKEFHDQIFDRHKSANSTVLFSEWRGFSSNRVRVQSSGCELQYSTMKASPSKQLVQDVDSYIEKHLGSSPGYVAVVLRIEKAKKLNKPPDYCFQQTLEYWERMVRDTGINTTFLSTDIGKFGSKSYNSNNSDQFFSSFFDTLYGKKMTIEQWEATFEGSSSHPGYVGVLQKVIASRAECVLFTGGGSFQRHLLQLYHERHPGKDCVYVVRTCLGDAFP